jgi:hypothetical protein
MDGAVGDEAECGEMRQAYLHDFTDHPASRLVKSRLAAGFRSGKAAADAHGWPIGTYTADEGGRRAIKPERAAGYAQAFGVPEEWLLGGALPEDGTPEADRARILEGLPVGDVSARFVGLSDNVPAGDGAAGRLAEARRKAGFGTARKAAKHFGWRISTYHGHENGQNNLNTGSAHRYGLAFGVDPAWLLGGGAVAQGRNDLGAVRATPSTEVASGASLAPAWMPSSDIERAAIARLEPQAILTAAPAGAIVLAVVSMAPNDCRIEAGDRVLIDSGIGFGDPGLFAELVSPGTVRVVRVGAETPPGPALLGKVVLVIAEPR